MLEDHKVSSTPAVGLFQFTGTALPARPAPSRTTAAHDGDVEMQEAPAPAGSTIRNAVAGPELEMSNEDLYAPPGDVAMAEEDDVASGDAVMAEDDNVAESMNQPGLDTSAEPLPDYVPAEDDGNAPPRAFSSNFFALDNEQEAPGATQEDVANADRSQHLGFNPDDLMRPREEDDLAWLRDSGLIPDDAAHGSSPEHEGYAPAQPRSTQPTANESSGDQLGEVQDSTSPNELLDDDVFELLDEWLSGGNDDLSAPLRGRQPERKTGRQ